MNKSNKTKVILASVFLSFCFMLSGGAYVTAQDSDVDFAASGPVTTQVEQTGDGKFYLNFKNATLINVLNVLSELSTINFVAGKEIADRPINMTLDNVSLEDVLDAIARGSNVNYEFIPGRNIYLFRALADDDSHPALMTKVFKLYYVRVSQLKEIESSSSSSTSSSSSSSSSSSTTGTAGGGLSTLSGGESDVDLEGAAILKAVEKILSERGKVSVDDRSNSLVVTDSEDRLKMIEETIAQLDRPLDQVLINVILVETFDDLDRQLGIEWANTTDNNGSFGLITGGVSDTNWPFMTKSAGNNFFDSAKGIFTDATKQWEFSKNTGAITTNGTRDFSRLTIELKALQNASKLKILAKPKILVLDNHPALIKIATNSAIGEVTTTSGGTSGIASTTSSAERTETGTILRVTPLINTGERITMTVEPTFATVDESALSVGAHETGDPTVRTARTTLMVNDGQTIALGGLLLSQQSNGDRKVPLLSDIPLLGRAFFTRNSKSISDRELILFVTPYIIRDPSVLETPTVPDKRLRMDDENAQFWKVKQKEWYKNMDKEPEKPIDFDQYFDVRKKLMNTVLDTLDQKANTQETSTSASVVQIEKV